MTREIKFRAWDGSKIDYDPWFDEYSSGGAPVNAFKHDERTFMQFTGLHDREGKEIYENDILQTYDFNGNSVERLEVVWELNGFVYKNPKTPEQSEYVTTKLVSVIGNRYENPELLTTKRI